MSRYTKTASQLETLFLAQHEDGQVQQYFQRGYREAEARYAAAVRVLERITAAHTPQQIGDAQYLAAEALRELDK